jgi:hypothetical protein
MTTVSHEGLLFSSKGVYSLAWWLHFSTCEWITFPCLLVCFHLLFAFALVSPLCEGMVTQALVPSRIQIKTVVVRRFNHTSLQLSQYPNLNHKSYSHSLTSSHLIHQWFTHRPILL